MSQTISNFIVLLVCSLCAVLLVYQHGFSNQELFQTSRRLEASSNVTQPATKKLEFDKAISLSQDVLSLIRNRYELDGPIGSQFFLAANNIGELTWETLKYKYAVKMVEGNQDFLMIFAGSSVTAGHDSYFNQSFPSIVNARMNRILQAVGINLIVHNIAQGANNCAPYTLCYESMGGMDADFVGWEQSYNCGHDEPIFELAARYAGWSAHKGVIYYSASGAWSPSDCPASTDKIPYSSADWTPAKAGLKDWKPTAADLLIEKNLLNDYNKARSSAHRFSSWSTPEYRGVSPHGFNVWENNPLCKWKKDGKPVTGCNGIDAAQKCSMKFMTHEASLYGSDDQHGANWHPTRAFHMLRGEAIAWLYTLTLLDSLYMVQRDLQTKSAAVLLTEYKSRQNQLQPGMPAPRKCSSYHCDKRPMCYTNFQPHFSKDYTLSDLVVGPSNWTYDDGALGEWSQHYGYLDAKPLFQAKGADNVEMHIKIRIRNTNFVYLCGNVKESLLHATVFLDANVVLPGNVSNYVPSAKRVEWTKKKYVGSECKSIIELPVGDHVLSIIPNKSHPSHLTALSHVIMWP